MMQEMLILFYIASFVPLPVQVDRENRLSLQQEWREKIPLPPFHSSRFSAREGVHCFQQSNDPKTIDLKRERFKKLDCIKKHLPSAE